MISKEAIKKEIDNIPEERLDDLHEIIKELVVSSQTVREKGNLMARLRHVKIHGPKDFSKNIDA
ncbi:hypothetical protein A2V82_01455 [candidate division KSB1 bacterium RBG_16_48_16]|nr:MAG: hypothetical protein A2V82_01455 [candidate division KSB1 bacterium RBG_16_48_16]